MRYHHQQGKAKVLTQLGEDQASLHQFHVSIRNVHTNSHRGYILTGCLRQAINIPHRLPVGQERRINAPQEFQSIWNHQADRSESLTHEPSSHRVHCTSSSTPLGGTRKKDQEHECSIQSPPGPTKLHSSTQSNPTISIRALFA
ncbi:hypothetical protein Nepgr_019566 [Nepenthes gracilis]|uniref:Uncharacterized protein n=1 Tax=Nepenthes gracilis TaxID=150966 RepID=A0AAD3SVA2_NEPGR|nr:hypothetical protein Nepgr_019566 [Nepenthes gracilis]